MKKIPLSYFTCSKSWSDAMLPNLFVEFAANGAENMVIDETMACKILDDPRYYSNLERFARGAGVKLFEIHAPFGECWDLNCSVKARRPYLVEGHIKCMNYAAEAGCRTYVIHVGAWDCIFRPEISIEKMRELALETLEKLLPEAEKAGIVLAVENSFEMSNATDEVLGLLKNFDSPFLGCCFDAGHANYMAPSRDGKPKVHLQYLVEQAWRGNLIEEPAALEKLLPHIVTCHLHDNSGVGDDHNLPGRGTADWAAVMPKLLSAPRLISCQSEVNYVANQVSIKELCQTMSSLMESK
jgi:sugar phosphate isomerase/epimerase